MTTETMAALSERKKEIRRLRPELDDKDAVIASLETDRRSNKGNFNFSGFAAMPFADMPADLLYFCYNHD